MVFIIVSLLMMVWSPYLNAIRKALKKPKHKIDDFFVVTSATLGVIIFLLTAILAMGNYYMNRKFAAKYEANPCDSYYRVNEEIVKQREFEHDPFFGIFNSSRIANFPTVNCRTNPPTFTPSIQES